MSYILFKNIKDIEGFMTDDKYGSIYGYNKARFTRHFNMNELDVGGSFFFDKIVFSDEANLESFVGEDWWTRINKL